MVHIFTSHTLFWRSDRKSRHRETVSQSRQYRNGFVNELILTMLTARLAAQRAVRVCRHNVIKAYVQQNISSPRPYNQFDQSINAHRWASSRSKPSTNPQPIDQTFKPGNDIKFSENTTPTTQPGPRAAGSDPANPVPRPDNVNAQHEAEKLAKDTSHGSNTIPFSQPGPRAANSDPGNPVPNPAPGTTAYNNSTDPDVNTNTAQQPLPDLRQGISSTFGRETGQDSASSNPDLDALLNQGGRRPREPYRPDEYETSTDRRRNRVANILYSTFAITGLIGSLYFGRPYSTSDTVPAGLDPAYVSSWSPSAIWARVKSRSKSSVGYYTEPPTLTLLPPRDPKQAPPLTLVLSLEDLLVHSGWTREHGWRTAKRPGLDYFLRYLSQYYEIVLFSTVPHHIGDPIVKKLDPVHLMQFTLFREATKFENGKHVKDLSYLNRPLETTVVIDTRAEHVANQPENAYVLVSLAA